VIVDLALKAIIGLGEFISVSDDRGHAGVHIEDESFELSLSSAKFGCFDS
jgi:hypothetical protein